MYDQSNKINDMIGSANNILIIQADNPDADSLGSALALEQILSQLGKQVYLYCGIHIPDYLHYMLDWSRVTDELPSNFDLSITVDASTLSLLEKLTQNNLQGIVGSKPGIVLDHHEQVENLLPFASATINDIEASSAGEVIYNLAKNLGWPLNVVTMEYIMMAILGDTQGLSNSLTKPSTYRLVADMIDGGVDRAMLEDRRREYSKMTTDIVRFKGSLLQRLEYFDNNRLVIAMVNNDEINHYSPLYNPKLLVQSEMLQTKNVLVGVVFKVYDNGRITASIRCNPKAPLAGEIAKEFGGGGHKFASGFRIEGGQSYDQVKTRLINFCQSLIANLELPTDEAIQHTF